MFDHHSSLQPSSQALFFPGLWHGPSRGAVTISLGLGGGSVALGGQGSTRALWSSGLWDTQCPPPRPWRCRVLDSQPSVRGHLQPGAAVQQPMRTQGCSRVRGSPGALLGPSPRTEHGGRGPPEWEAEEREGRSGPPCPRAVSTLSTGALPSMMLVCLHLANLGLNSCMWEQGARLDSCAGSWPGREGSRESGPQHTAATLQRT